MKMTTSDLDLLRKYSREGSESAFGELVSRHVNLVHSSALRQVRSSQLAEEVAQSVFTDLAKKASALQENTILSAWLYQVTRRTAIDVVRRESRRQQREQIAAELAQMNAHTADWPQIEPLLDEAMESLDATDRTAVLLRYFENKSLRDVGQALGTSDDAAQKRVSRAVERLREFFTQRGVGVGASGLVAAVSANAVQAAPVGLVVSISTAAAAVAGTAITTKTIAMTTLQKTLFTVTVAGAIGFGVYEAQQNSKLREAIAPLRKQQAALEVLRKERYEAEKQIAALQSEQERWSKDFSELLRLRGDVGLLRKQIATKATNAVALEEEFLEKEARRRPVETYKADIRAAVEWNHAIVMGGWATPSGKRAIIFVVPSKNDWDTNAQLTIETHIAELPDECVKQLGLDWFLMDGTETGVVGDLGPEAYAAVMKSANGMAGVDVLHAPKLTTLSGRQAQVAATSKRTIAGEDFETGPVVNFLPTISDDGRSVALEISAVLNLARP